MVFDSPEMNALRIKYGGELNHRVPDIVFLDRYDGYKNEREAIEKLVSSVSTSKQNDWLGRFINPDHQQHVGAWFEIMLFGWLKEHFQVQVEPEIAGCYPDFLVAVNDNIVVIEAIAYLATPQEITDRIMRLEFTYLLETIERPYAVNLKIKRFGSRIEKDIFVSQVHNWLDHSKDKPLHYQDAVGNILELTVAYETKLNKIGVMVTGNFEWINTDLVKPSLRRKAKQHRGLKDSNYPYVIAILLESGLYSADEVVDAWLGKPQVVFDRVSDRIIHEQTDQSGITYYGKKVQNTRVSGILVFSASDDQLEQTRFLKTWYIENPYARNKVEPNFFPVNGSFIVVSNKANMFEMQWIGTIP